MHSRTPIARAKARFAELVRRAERGETVILTRHGRPVARLAPVARSADPEPPTPREPGSREPEVRETEAAYGAPQPDGLVAPKSRRELLEQVLEEAVWPRLPADQLGTAPSKREREEILGYRAVET